MNKPTIKPNNSNFSSGPTTKRPGWSLAVLNNSLLGRSHRSAECKARLKQVIDLSKEVTGLPSDYAVGIMPGSNTGALEAALWCLLGERGIDVLAWENFGKDWVIDVADELKILDRNVYVSDYGSLPDLNKVDFSRDVIFTWNGTTAGVKVPNGEWIDANRTGLTLCDATSAIFAMPIDYEKCDVITWSWQKILGGEAAHGMIALSPRALQRLESYQPTWPVPKALRLAQNKKVDLSIFEGNIINTPSMLCVEDALDALQWVKSIGGIHKMFQRSDLSLQHVSDWVNENDWVDFMNPTIETRSNTGITFKITEQWFLNLNEANQREIMGKITDLLTKEEVAHDINGYPKAPPSFRVWGGGTVEPENIQKLLPWITWAYNAVKP